MADDKTKNLKLTFASELIGDKILMRCKETNDVATVNSIHTAGKFILKQHGLETKEE